MAILGIFLCISIVSGSMKIWPEALYLKGLPSGSGDFGFLPVRWLKLLFVISCLEFLSLLLENRKSCPFDYSPKQILSSAYGYASVFKVFPFWLKLTSPLLIWIAEILLSEDNKVPVLSSHDLHKLFWHSLKIWLIHCGSNSSFIFFW